MFTNTLSIRTANTPFEEIFNLLTFESSTTKTTKQIMSPSPDELGIYHYSAVLLVEVPLAEKIGIPSKIYIGLRGQIDSLGNSLTLISIPDQYKNYLEAIEIINITSNGNIKIDLKYIIKEMNDTSSILSTIKSNTYNNMVSSMKSHIMSLYETKRKICFCRESPCKINDIESLIRHFVVKS